MKSNFIRYACIPIILAFTIIEGFAQIDEFSSVDTSRWEPLPDLPGPFEVGGVCQIIDGKLHVISGFNSQQWILPLNQGDENNWDVHEQYFTMDQFPQSTLLSNAWVILTRDMVPEIDQQDKQAVVQVASQPLYDTWTTFIPPPVVDSQSMPIAGGFCGNIDDGSIALCCGGYSDYYSNQKYLAFQNNFGFEGRRTSSCFAFKYRERDGTLQMSVAPQLPEHLDSACSGSNGDVFAVAGGYNGDQDQVSVDVYIIHDLEEGWKKVEVTADGVTALSQQAGVMIGNTLVCLGGYSEDLKEHVDSTVVVDVSTGSVSEGLKLPNPAAFGCAAVHGGYIYLIEGTAGGAAEVWRASKKVWRASLEDVLGTPAQPPSEVLSLEPLSAFEPLPATTVVNIDFFPVQLDIEFPTSDAPDIYEPPPAVEPPVVEPPSQDIPAAAIAGGTGGAIVLLVILGLMVILIVRFKKNQTKVPDIMWNPTGPIIGSNPPHGT